MPNFAQSISPIIILATSLHMLGAQAGPAAHADSSHHPRSGHVALGIGLLAAAVAIDAPVARHFNYTASSGTLNTARQFDRFGDATGIGVAVGGLAVASLVTRDPRVLRTTKRVILTLLAASTVTQAMKYTIDRSRPDQDPDRDGFDFYEYQGTPAFPSGHTSTAFALATSLGDATGKTWARVTLYAFATGTGWARLQEQVHWVSDVVAGAAVGIAAAKFAEGKFTVFGVRAPRFLISPRGVGVMFPLGRLRRE